MGESDGSPRSGLVRDIVDTFSSLIMMLFALALVVLGVYLSAKTIYSVAYTSLNAETIGLCILALVGCVFLARECVEKAHKWATDGIFSRGKHNEGNDDNGDDVD